MQAKKAPLLERILTVIISCALIFAGLCIYSCLVAAYEGHRVSFLSVLARNFIVFQLARC